MASVNKNKKACKYGESCYRTNEDHLKNFEHKADEDIENKMVGEAKNQPRGTKRTRQAISENVKVAAAEEPTTKRAEPKIIEGPAETKTTEIKNNKSEEKVESTADCYDLSEVKDFRDFVFEHYSMHMPDDFYELLDFCKSLNAKDPKNALKLIEVELTGAYDLILSGAKFNYKLHSRYYYDTPEFQTVLKVTNSPTHLHFGYFRDDPNEMPGFVAINEPTEGCTISCKGENLFAALIWFIDELISKRKYQPKANVSADELKKLKKSIEEWCEKAKKSRKQFPLQLKTNKIKEREKKMNCKTFHQAGIYVHVDANGVGYREVPETDDSQRKMFKNFCNKENANLKTKADESIQEIITLIQFANDEMDYGMALEFGTNMFCFGETALHKYIKAVLPTAYALLGRDLYTDILKEHLKHRKNPI